MRRRARGTASLAVLAILVAGPAFANTVTGGGDPPGPLPVNPPPLPSTPVQLPATPPAPVPDPTPVVDAAQQAATTTSQQATDTVNQVVNAAVDASRTQGPGGPGTSAPSGRAQPAAAPRLTRRAPQPVSAHRQPGSRHTVRVAHRARASAPIVTITPVHRVHARGHRAAPRHVARRVRAPAVPALPVLAPAPPRPASHAPSAHHGGIHHSLAVPLPLSNRAMLIGLGLLLALALLALRFFAVDVLPGVRAGISARRHPW